MRVTAYADDGDGLMLVGVEDFEHLVHIAGLSHRLTIESLSGPALDEDTLGQQPQSGRYRFRHPDALNTWTEVQWTRQGLSTFDFMSNRDGVQWSSRVCLQRQEDGRPEEDDVHAVAQLLREAFSLRL